MKVQDLFEAKISWKIDSDKSDVATYKGHNLVVKNSDRHYVGTIDGKEVASRRAQYYADRTKVMNALKNEVDHMHLSDASPGTTVNKLLDYVKASLGHLKLNNWDWDYAQPGDMEGGKKSKYLTVQLDKEIKAQKEWTGKHFPSTHRFMIQATFSTDENAKHDLATIWLSQGGQLITVGIPNEKFKHGDIDSFIAAIKKLASKTDEDLITLLYKSGYHQYGRA